MQFAFLQFRKIKTDLHYRYLPQRFYSLNRINVKTPPPHKNQCVTLPIKPTATTAYCVPSSHLPNNNKNKHKLRNLSNKEKDKRIPDVWWDGTSAHHRSFVFSLVI